MDTTSRKPSSFDGRYSSGPKPSLPSTRASGQGLRSATSALPQTRGPTIYDASSQGKSYGQIDRENLAGAVRYVNARDAATGRKPRVTSFDASNTPTTEKAYFERDAQRAQQARDKLAGKPEAFASMKQAVDRPYLRSDPASPTMHTQAYVNQASALDDQWSGSANSAMRYANDVQPKAAPVVTMKGAVPGRPGLPLSDEQMTATVTGAPPAENIRQSLISETGMPPNMYNQVAQGWSTPSQDPGQAGWKQRYPVPLEQSGAADLGTLPKHQQLPMATNPNELPRSGIDEDWEVAKVLDGDTLDLQRYGQPLRVRMSQIDALESGQALGPQATSHMRSLVGENGALTSLTPGPQESKGKRQLGWIKDAEGNDVGDQMLGAGYAALHPAYSRHASNASRAAQSQAKAAGAGLWGIRSTFGAYQFPWIHKEIARNRR